MKHVSIERQGRISIVRFDRGIAANPLSLELIRELTEAARAFDDDAETSAVILAGRADNFTMGFDLKDPEVAALREAGLAERRLGLMAGGRMCRAWEEIQALTISAIEGWCVGGGVALAVSTDLRVAGRGSGFYVPEIERGMNMSWGSVPRITNLAGPARAKRIVILAEKVMAERAEEWGLADELADDGAALDAAMVMAEPGRIPASGRPAHVQAGHQRLCQRARPHRQPQRLRPVRPGPGQRRLRRRGSGLSGETPGEVYRQLTAGAGGMA